MPKCILFINAFASFCKVSVQNYSNSILLLLKTINSTDETQIMVNPKTVPTMTRSLLVEYRSYADGPGIFLVDSVESGGIPLARKKTK